MRWVADPQGTGRWQITTDRPGLARSPKRFDLLGLPGAVTTTNVLAAKLPGSPASNPALATVFICGGVGRCEDVCSRALRQPGRQIGGAGELEFDAAPGLSVLNC